MTRPASGPRRWPDLLIGLLVLLLLGGFGTLLLRGTPQPAATSAAGTDMATDASIPAAPGTDPAAVQAAPTGTLESAPAETAPAGTPDSGAAAPSDTTAQDTAPVIEAAPIGAPLVADPATAEPASPNPADATGSTEASTDTATTPEDQTATDPATTGGPTPRPEGAVRTSESRVPLRSDYRITLGTFSSETAAQNAAAPVQGIGYTVYPIDLGAQVVAQIGPFADEQSARQALADVQRAYPSAVLYPPRNQPAADSTTPATPAPTADTPAATAPTTGAPSTTPSGPTYLQVGAFDRVESAQNLVQQLRDLGYAPTVNAPEGKKVTVLVGPYANPDALTRTETRLATNGLDSFRVR